MDETYKVLSPTFDIKNMEYMYKRISNKIMINIDSSYTFMHTVEQNVRCESNSKVL